MPRDPQYTQSILSFINNEEKLNHVLAPAESRLSETSAEKIEEMVPITGESSSLAIHPMISYLSGSRPDS